MHFCHHKNALQSPSEFSPMSPPPLCPAEDAVWQPSALHLAAESAELSCCLIFSFGRNETSQPRSAHSRGRSRWAVGSWRCDGGRRLCAAARRAEPVRSQPPAAQGPRGGIGGGGRRRGEGRGAEGGGMGREGQLEGNGCPTPYFTRLPFRIN